MNARADTYPFAHPCGCSLEGYCDRHRAMMHEIYDVWNTSRSSMVLKIIWSLQDGYGEPGFMPSQGYDWSGIRDSTPAAIEAMSEAIHA